MRLVYYYSTICIWCFQMTFLMFMDPFSLSSLSFSLIFSIICSSVVLKKISDKHLAKQARSLNSAAGKLLQLQQ